VARVVICVIIRLADMPDIDTSTSDLTWLRPHWSETPNMSLVGLKIMEDRRKEQRSQMMEMLNYNLREKEANVRMQTEIMQQKSAHDFMDDFPKVNAWAQNPDQPIPTDLKSPKSMELIDQVMLRRSQSIVLKDSTKAFADRVKALNGVSPELAGAFAPYIGRIPTPEILDRLSTAEVQADELKRLRMEQPLAPGERRTTKEGGITTTQTGAKLETPEEMALKTRALDLRGQQIAIEDERLKNATEQMRLRDKSLNVQQRRSMQVALKANPHLLDEVNRLQTKMVDAGKELADLQASKASGSKTSGLWRRDIDTVITEQQHVYDAAKAEHESLVSTVLESLGMSDTPKVAPAATTTPKKRVRVIGPTGQTGTIEEGDTLPQGWKLQP